MHDPLCRGIYQRYTDPKNCVSCDLIWAVREDDKKKYAINIGKLEAAYIEGRQNALDIMSLFIDDPDLIARIKNEFSRG